MPTPEYRYDYCHKDNLQATLDVFTTAGWTVHTITFLGAMVHVLFERSNG